MANRGVGTKSLIKGTQNTTELSPTEGIYLFPQNYLTMALFVFFFVRVYIHIHLYVCVSVCVCMHMCMCVYLLRHR